MHTGFFDIEIRLSMFVMFMVIILVVYPVSRSAMRKGRSVLPFVLPLAFGIGCIGLIILLDETLGYLHWVRYFLDSEIRMIYSWWLFACLGGIILAAQGVKIFMRRKSLKRLGKF